MVLLQYCGNRGIARSVHRGQSSHGLGKHEQGAHLAHLLWESSSLIHEQITEIWKEKKLNRRTSE